MSKKWYKPKRHSGFKKERTIDQNVRNILRRTGGNALRGGRQMVALANVTQDTATAKKARAVAKRLFQINEKRKKTKPKKHYKRRR